MATQLISGCGRPQQFCGFQRCLMVREKLVHWIDWGGEWCGGCASEWWLSAVLSLLRLCGSCTCTRGTCRSERSCNASVFPTTFNEVVEIAGLGGLSPWCNGGVEDKWAKSRIHMAGIEAEIWTELILRIFERHSMRMTITEISMS